MPRPSTDEPTALSTETRWYCVKTQPKRENVAHGQLCALGGVEAFFPRIRFKRTKTAGPREVVEALFPGYVFARFCPAIMARAVRYAQGVAYIVRLGRNYAPLSDTIITELRSLATSQVLDLPTQPWQLGEQVRVVAGIFQGTSGRVTGFVPARRRVEILMELLGGENRVEIPLDALEQRHTNPLHI